MTDTPSLLDIDPRHLLHPLPHTADYDTALIFTRGESIRLTASDGRTYIDGLSGLWNVLIGHGNQELAETAQKQMVDLAFCSSYIAATSTRPSNSPRPWPVLPAARVVHRYEGQYPDLAPPPTLIVTETEINEIVGIIQDALTGVPGSDR